MPIWRPKLTTKNLLGYGLKAYAKDSPPEQLYDAMLIARKAQDQLERAERDEKWDRMVDLTDALCWRLGQVLERLAWMGGGSRRGMTMDAMSIRQRVNQIRRELRS